MNNEKNKLNNNEENKHICSKLSKLNEWRKKNILISNLLFWILIVVFFFVGISLLVSSFIYFFSFENVDFSMFISILTISLILVGSTFSFGMNYWLNAKNSNKESNIEYLKTMKEDVNNYLNHLNQKSERTRQFDKQIEYIFDVNAKITNKLGKILSGEDKYITEIEKIQFRTNTKEDFKEIVNIINENKKIRNKAIKIIKAENFNLIYSDLSGLNLSGLNFERANLWRANLSFANLSKTNFNNANLSGADLSGANISDANFTSAKLDDFFRIQLEKLANQANQKENESVL